MFMETGKYSCPGISLPTFQLQRKLQFADLPYGFACSQETIVHWVFSPENKDHSFAPARGVFFHD